MVAGYCNRYIEFKGELRLKMEAGERDAKPVRGCIHNQCPR